jgi:FkbM family methyltransferase
MITYAQNFEDVMLARLFQRQTRGFYIDIGAWHPSLHSVTRHFYDLGWSGINVEPIQRLHQLFVQERPRDKNLNVAVGAVAGRMQFYECTDLTSLSTASVEQVDALRHSGHNVQSYEIDVVTLDDIYAHCNGRIIDFLKVDVEGFEEQVLRGANWDHFRPRVLVIEATLPAVQITDWDNIEAVRNWDAWEPLLLQAGYKFALYDGLSRFYVRAEEERLKARLLLPPCVHDDLHSAAEQRLLKELAAQSARSATLSATLEAKNEVIKTLAVRELERKAFLAGSADVLFHRRYRGTPPGGRLIPAQPGGSQLHIAIDALELVFGVSGGVETYMKMLTSALLASDRRVTLICLPDQLAALQKQFQDQVAYFVVQTSRAVRLANQAANCLHSEKTRLTVARSMASYARIAEQIGVDILHSPVQIFSALDFCLPSVLNLHDLQHLHFPENFSPRDIEARNHLFGLSAALADAIIVSSDFVRNDITTQLHVQPSKVFTIPVTWDPMVINGLASFTAEHARAHYRLPGTFAIYPAQFWPHKNHVRLVQALRIVRDRMPAADFKLVFTGYRGHSGWPRVEETIQQLGLASDVICLDHVPVQHLAGLYKSAVFCVMPSTFEASSYPVIEAQLLGVPAMCSNVTSLPELMRDGAGLLFDPFDEQDIAAKMIRWLEDPDDRRAHAERAVGKVRKEHSLASYVAGVGQVYDCILTNRKSQTR